MAKATVSRATQPRNAFVYILQSATGLLKVGMSCDPESRLRSLLTGHPFGLDIAYLLECDERLAYPVEQATHKLLNGRRVNGEWFDVPLEDAVQALMNVLEIFLLSAKAPPRQEWHWKCALDKRDEQTPTCDEHNPEELVDAAPVVRKHSDVGFPVMIIGQGLSFLAWIPWLQGRNVIPLRAYATIADFFGWQDVTVMGYTELVLRVIAPMVLLTGLYMIYDSTSKNARIIRDQKHHP